jgi:hypothetical protein
MTPQVSGAVYPDVRRHVAFVTQGLTRILVSLQALLQDVNGAVADGQYRVAAHAGRSFVVECLAVRGIARGGELLWAPEVVTYDPFAGATPQERRAAVDLLDRGGRLATPEEAERWRDELAAMLLDLQESLGLGRDLPELRSPEGMFAALRLARGAFELVDRFQLAPILPTSWTEAVAPDDEQEGA